MTGKHYVLSNVILFVPLTMKCLWRYAAHFSRPFDTKMTTLDLYFYLVPAKYLCMREESKRGWREEEGDYPGYFRIRKCFLL